MALLSAPMVPICISARFTIEVNTWTNFSVFNLVWFNFISGRWCFDIQFIFWFEFLAIVGSAHANISSGITLLCIWDNQLNTLLLQIENKKYWSIFWFRCNVIANHCVHISFGLTWILLGSRRSPSLFHVTVLSGDDDLQSTAIESPGCKYERAGSNFTYGTDGTNGSNPCWDATMFIERVEKLYL